MPAHKEQKVDNWKIYLPLNYHDFSMADFGQLTAMKPIDNQQIMFLFDKSSPYVTVGRDQLQIDGSGKKVTLGDGGLFERDPRPITYTDTHYGNSQSKWAFNVTPYGIFYPSQRQGNVFNYSGKLNDISDNGMHFWFQNHLPSRLMELFPNFNLADNPVIGTSLQSAFDATNKVYYLSKKDYVQIGTGLTYDENEKVFKLGTRTVEFGDPRYFEDASWTISFDPKTNSFISFHDWHPDWMLQSEKIFFTTKGTGIWKHNDRHDSFCNFYGVDYPFEIEYLVNNGQNVEILKSLEYFLEIGKYFNEGRDFHQILDGNFDEAVVSNNEQSSGLLKLFLRSKNNLTQHFNFPRFDSVNEWTNVLYDKEEQKHRLDMFTDIVKDRGEFTLNNYPLWISKSNGYVKDVNNRALNFAKPVQHQKKFRGLWHKILLRKLVSDDKKMIFKFANAKETVSFR
jgi:hypothetical protein